MGYSEKTVQSWESETNPRCPPNVVELFYIARRILKHEHKD